MLSDIEIKVSASEFIEGLNLNEQKKLVELLKKHLGEEYDKPIEGTPPGRIEADIFVDMDDAVNELGWYDRKELYEDLHGEFGEDADTYETVQEMMESEASTYTDREIAAALAEIWRSKDFLTPNQLQRIQAITKEPFI
jgi:hypothetical protein